MVIFWSPPVSKCKTCTLLNKCKSSRNAYDVRTSCDSLDVLCYWGGTTLRSARLRVAELLSEGGADLRRSGAQRRAAARSGAERRGAERRSAAAGSGAQRSAAVRSGA